MSTGLLGDLRLFALNCTSFSFAAKEPHKQKAKLSYLKIIYYQSQNLNSGWLDIEWLWGIYSTEWKDG